MRTVSGRIELSGLNITVKVRVTCPKCSHSFIVKVKEAKVKAEVTCLACGYKWYYEGSGSYRIRCPRCHSAKNDFNRERFGEWSPEELP